MLAAGPLLKLLSAYLLLALCVVVHVVGMVALFRALPNTGGHPGRPFAARVWLLVRLSWGIVLLNLVTIGVWALFFWRQGCLPDLRTVYDFSSMTYTTVGYGDVILAAEWWSMAGATFPTGMLMVGLSAAFFFAYLGPLLGQPQRA
ncbi:MAG: hypothetical protein WEC15_04500 [Flavobacteriales bacterium]